MMARSRPTREELDHAVESVVYEINMLRSTAQLLDFQGFVGTAYNALIESFAIHARSLIDFLRNRGDHRDIVASDFVGDWSVNDATTLAAMEGIWQKASLSVVHITRRRVAHVGPAKDWDFGQVLAVLNPSIDRFLRESGLESSEQAARFRVSVVEPTPITRGHHTSSALPVFVGDVFDTTLRLGGDEGLE